MPCCRAALAALPLLVLPAVLAGCSTDDGGDDGTLEVLASFYPLQYVAQQVGGDHVTVSNLTPPAAEPHDLELSPAQMREIGTSDLVVYSSGFQTAVDEAVETQSPEHVVDAADVVELEAHPGTPSAAADEHTDESGDEHAEDDGHDHGTLDPHFWLDPTRLIPLGHAVAGALADADPEHAAAYAEGARDLERQVRDLDREFSAALEECESRTLVTSHEAFGYLAERYDLEQVGIVGLDPEAEPSPARLREVGAVVADSDASTIFTETLTSPKVAETLAADVGVDTAVLDPLEGLSEDAVADGADYVSVMRDNLAALAEGPRCS